MNSEPRDEAPDLLALFNQVETGHVPVRPGRLLLAFAGVWLVNVLALAVLVLKLFSGGPR